MVIALIQVEHQCCQTQSQAHLWQALNSLAEDGGLWNGRAFADWVAQLKGKPIHRQHGWEYLRQMNFRQLVPRASMTKLISSNSKKGKKTKLGTGAAASKVSRS
ncbi:winged helix-turn-helix domain-containing protein [Microcoleus sp. herbarium2]|uniref:winged helix-turn-helix domain-containing protein n=1 Tax=Microcoleus sp. herbarium2 TaxID=3055433 RepID=UPI00404084FB